MSIAECRSEGVCKQKQVTTTADLTAAHSCRRRLAEVVGRMRVVFTSCTVDTSDVRVPLTVSLLLIGGYVLLGALLFGLWESEWDILVGSYFCFVTLSTIGFGDVVPGTSLDEWSSTPKLVLCSMYVVCGLAMLAMCFDLMQEQVRQVCASSRVNQCGQVIKVRQVCRDVACRLGLVQHREPAA